MTSPVRRFLLAAYGIAAMCVCAAPSFPAFGQSNELVYTIRRATEEAAFQRIRGLLATPLKTPLPAESLAAMAKRLRQQGLPVVIDKRALDDVGISAKDLKFDDLPSGITLRSALNLRLKANELTFTIRHETLMLTTQESAEYTLETRIYDISKLAPVTTFTDFNGRPYSGRDFDTLIDVITSTVAPESWDEVGGPGAISALDVHSAGLLVISQSQETLDKIEVLLRTLHRAGRVTLPTTLMRRAAVGRGASSIPRSSIRRSQLPGGR